MPTFDPTRVCPASRLERACDRTITVDLVSNGAGRPGSYVVDGICPRCGRRVGVRRSDGIVRQHYAEDPHPKVARLPNGWER